MQAGLINSTDQYMVPNIWYTYSACVPLAAEAEMHRISSFVMFIPFFIVGLAECLVNPVLMYFVYDQVWHDVGDRCGRSDVTDSLEAVGPCAL